MNTILNFYHYFLCQTIIKNHIFITSISLQFYIYNKFIQKKLAKHLKTDIENVSIKASTSEKLSFTGRGEGIEARAVVLLEKID